MKTFATSVAATLFAAAVTVAAGNAGASIDRTLNPISPIQNGIVMPPVETHRAGSKKSPILMPGEYQVAPTGNACPHCRKIGPRRRPRPMRRFRIRRS